MAESAPGVGGKRRHPLRWLLVGGVAVAALLWYMQRTAPPEGTMPLPALAASPYLNTAVAVRYVGSEACRACHVAEHASFHRTGMGRSMALVDPQHEPPDADFDHRKSGRRYQIVRKDGKMLHRELRLGGAAEIVLSEYPVQYVVGSGRHSLTYLVEAEGFLVESPVTWYTAKKSWGMSPGYDQAEHAGFERAIGESCLICHAGQAEPIGGSLHRMEVKEAAIGCERCHGPGELHVARHTGKPGGGEVGAIDFTIVNPARLPRPLAEAVCQQCRHFALPACAAIGVPRPGAARFSSRSAARRFHP